MRMLFAALVVAVPFAAHAAKLSDNEVQTSFNECVRSCDETRSYAYCARMCGCMAHEMGRVWTSEQLQAREGVLRSNRQDRATGEQMGRLAAHCAAGMRPAAAGPEAGTQKRR